MDPIRFVQRVEKRVTLHYHTGHPQSDLDWASTRTILKAIPGLEYVEVPNPPTLGRHGSPKYINRIGREKWQGTITGILRSAETARADILATIYRSCHPEICAEEAQCPFEIVNYVSLLGEAMGIEHPDANPS